MKRILIADGCDRYDTLDSLCGAEHDAVAVHKQLLGCDYDADASTLLLSPTVDEIINVMSALPFGRSDIDTLTFFFAGHGGEKFGTYYLCARDTDPSRLSTSGFAASRILSVISELRPLQANVIIDACQSGSAMLDTAALLRADALGLDSPGSLSIAFLAACGPNEYAAETVTGGELTRRVLAYLSGSATLQTTRPSLDLIDLGRRVSGELGESLTEQVPVTWGINLIGEGRFAPNPRFSPSTEDLAGATYALSSNELNERQREKLRSHSLELWNLHREVEEELHITSVSRTFGSVLADLGDDTRAIAATLRGLGTSMGATAARSAEPFAESLTLFASAAPLLSRLDDVYAAKVAQQLLDEAVIAQAHDRQWLINHLTSNRYCLLGEGNGIADLYFLPLRLTKILGWLAVGLELDRLSDRSNARAEQEVREIAERIVEQYSPSLVPRSDAQAALMITFVEAARRHGWTDLAEQVAGCYFDGFLEANGVIARPNLSDEDAFTFCLTLGAGADSVEHRFRANPTQFLSTLLYCGSALQLDDDWDFEFSRLDHCSGYLFVPTTYKDFANSVIQNGLNFGFQIGHDVFTVADFHQVALRVGAAAQSAKDGMTPLACALALVCACLQPDRLPWHVVERLGA